MDLESNKIKIRLNNEKVSFNVCKSMKQPMDLQVILVINVIDGEVPKHVDVILLNDPLVEVLCNCEREEVEEYDKVVSSLSRIGSYTKNLVKFDLDLKNHEIPLIKLSIIEPPKVELKPFPPHL